LFLLSQPNPLRWASAGSPDCPLGKIKWAVNNDRPETLLAGAAALPAKDGIFFDHIFSHSAVWSIWRQCVQRVTESK